VIHTNSRNDPTRQSDDVEGRDLDRQPLECQWTAEIRRILGSQPAHATHGRPCFARRGSQSSVAVLPFLDLTTEEMNEEYFADGITEELIGDLSRYPGLRVPAPTASFYFKGKQRAIADVARQLGVAYVLDGSVRKSGSQYRVAMRLVRADNGYVVYTETYEKPLGDLLSIQKNIAAEAAISIRNAIERADHGASWNVLIGSGQRVG
jgi:TolB-like protein